MALVDIDVWVADLTFPGYMERLHRLAASFNEAHPGLQVTVTGHDFRRLPQQIADAAAEGRRPAVAEYYFYMTPVARDTRTPDGQPLFTSVEQAIGGRREILGEPVVVDDLIPAARQFYSHQGELFSMPTVGTTMLIYGNMTLLRKAGVTELPRTWQEVEAVCAQIAEAGGPPYRITWANHGLFFQQAMAVQGAPLADNDNGRSAPPSTVHLDSEAMLAWVRWWRQLHQRGHYLYTGKIPDWEGTFRAFASGEVPLRITSSNDHDYMVAAATQAGFEIATGRFPYRQGCPHGGNIIAGTSLWLGSGLDEPTRDGALAFMQFLNRPRNAAERHKANSFLPITRSSFALLEEEGWFDRNPFHRVASDQLASHPAGVATAESGPVPAVRGALFGDFAGVQDVMTQAVHDILRGGAEPEQRLGQATAEAERLLADYYTDCRAGGPRQPSSLRVEFFTGAAEYSGADLENVAKLHE